MTDTQTMRDMLIGLQQKKKNLEANKEIFVKVSGINEEIERANQDKDTYADELKAAKDTRDMLKKKKSAAVSETIGQISAKINAVLPFGEAVFTYDEDDDGKRSMKIGWKNGDKITPYNGLSGMEKQVFDAALANVLDADIIVLEAAELDQDSMKQTLAELAGLDKQVIISICHPVGDVPEPFVVVEV